MRIGFGGEQRALLGVFPAARVIRAVVVAAALASSGGRAEAARVAGIEFTGNKEIESKKLSSLMETKSVSWFKRHVLRREPFMYDEGVLASDIARLERYYQREGFLDVRIEAPVCRFDRSGETVAITIPVVEGEPIFVNSVTRTWETLPSGERPPSGRASGHAALDVSPEAFERLYAKLKPDVKLLSRARFRDAAVLADHALLGRMLAEHGYPLADVSYSLAVSRERRAVDVLWRVAPGPLCVFDSIRVKGNARVRSAVIVRQALFEPGDRFDHRLLGLSQQRMYNLGMFQVVAVSMGYPDSLSSSVPIDVSVREARRFKAKMGAGYGREDGLRLSAEATRLGFLGGTRQLTVSLKRSDLEPYHGSVLFVHPAWLTPATTLNVRPFVRRQEEPSFAELRIGAEIAVSQNIGPWLIASTSYSYEGVGLDTGSVAGGLPRTADFGERYRKWIWAFTLSYDSSLPIFDQTRGFFAGAAVALSGLGLESSGDYVKVTGEYRRYDSVSRSVLACRLKAGGIEPSPGGDGLVPPEDRFYLGGSNSVRGWAYSQLGPKSEGLPAGGSSFIEAGVEARVPIAGSFWGAGFCDAGNVWSQPFTYRLDDLAYSAGCGLRFRTPIGPVRFDVAWPLTDIPDEAEKTQYILSIGQAF